MITEKEKQVLRDTADLFDNYNLSNSDITKILAMMQSANYAKTMWDMYVKGAFKK